MKRFILFFLQEPASPVRSAAFRYGMLAFWFVLLVWVIYLRSQRSFDDPKEGYGLILVCLVSISNHLAFQFHWGDRVRFTLRAMLAVFIGLTFAYLIFV